MSKSILFVLASFLPLLASATDAERNGVDIDSNAPATAAQLAPDPLRRAQVLGAIPAGGVLLVAESTNRRVLALDPATGDVIDANFVPADAVNLQTPVSAMLSPDGTQVLVSDQIRDVIQGFDVTSGAFVATFAPAGGANLAIADNIRGWEYAADGNLLVSVGGGANNNAIARFSPSGAPLTNFIAPGLGGIASPFDVFRLPVTSGPLLAGEYLISNSSNGGVNRFSASGVPVANFATAGTFAQQIAQADNGNVLVAVFSPPANDGVFEFSPTGTQIARLDNPTLAGYRGVWELANGNILTTNGGGIHELDRTTGALVRTIVPAVSARYIEFVQGAAAPPADLALTGSSGPISLGQPATINLTLTNNGPGAATNASVLLTLPPAVVYLSDSCATAGTPTARTWTAGNLAAAASANCSVTVRIDQPGTFIISAVARADGSDPQPGNNALNLPLGVAARAVDALHGWALTALMGLLALLGWVALRRRA